MKSIGSDTETTLGGAVVAEGEVVLTGAFKDTMRFGGGVPDLAGAAGDRNAFVARLSGASGEPVWAKQFGDDREQYGVAVVAGDVTTSGVFVTGGFFGSLNFGCELLMAAEGDMFVTRLGLDGHCIWSKKYNFSSTDFPESIAFDATNRLVIVNGTINSNQVLSLNAYGAEAGGLVSEERFSPPESGSPPRLTIHPSAAATRNGKSFIGGSFTGRINVSKASSVILESDQAGVGALDGFAVAYQEQASGPTAPFVWGKGYGPLGFQSIYGIATFASGGEDALFMAGAFDGTLVLDSGHTLSAPDGTNGFLARVDVANGSYGFSKQLIGRNADAEAVVAQPASNSLYVAGRFADKVEIDGHTLNKPAGAPDGHFLANFDAADGHHLQSAVIGRSDGAYQFKSMGVVGDDVILVGSYTQSLDFAGCAAITNGDGTSRIFAVRLRRSP